MKITVYRSKDGKRLRTKPPIHHALLVPIRKGVWFIDVCFKVRTDVEFYRMSSNKPNRIEGGFEINDGEYVVVRIDSDSEFDIYARMSKASYRGVIIDKKMVNRAVDRFMATGWETIS